MNDDWFQHAAVAGGGRIAVDRVCFSGRCAVGKTHVIAVTAAQRVEVAHTAKIKAG